MWNSIGTMLLMFVPIAIILLIELSFNTINEGDE